MSFTDSRVFIKSAVYPYMVDRVIASQHNDGPIYLHIGKLARDEACQSMADRYSLEVHELIKVRDNA